jgi:hypothetical protein
MTVTGDGTNGCASGQDAGLRAPVSGDYLVTAGLAWAGNANGERKLSIIDETSGVTAAGSEISANNATNGNFPPFTVQTASAVVPLAAGDIVELFALQNSGNPLGLATGDNRTFLTLTWLAPS